MTQIRAWLERARMLPKSGKEKIWLRTASATPSGIPFPVMITRMPNRRPKTHAHIITTGTQLARFIDALERMGDIPAFRPPAAQPELIQASGQPALSESAKTASRMGPRPSQPSPDEIKSATPRQSSPKRSRAA